MNETAPAPDQAQVVAILGAGPGMGTALARAFAGPSRHIVLLARNPDRLSTLIDELVAQDIRASGVPCDLASVSDVRRALAEVDATWGPPEILIYNASLYVPGAPTAADPEAVLDGLRISIIGALVAIQCVVPAMRVRGHGTLLFTGGGTAIEPWVEASGLSLQKAALRNLAQSTARELAPANIHAAIVTIAGVIGSLGFEPDTLASHYVSLHEQERSAWTHEVIVRSER